MRYKVWLASVCAIALSGVLSACGGDIRPQVSEHDIAPMQSISQAQAEKIRNDIVSVSEQATKDVKPESLDSVMTGPELLVRKSQLQVLKATHSQELQDLLLIPDTAQTLIPQQHDWPRSTFVITKPTSDQGAPRLLVFSQEKARENYKMWGLARLFSGVKLPDFTKDTIQQLDVHDTRDIMLSPLEAAQQYAKLLEDPNSSVRSSFGDDAFRKHLDTMTAAVQQAVQGSHGDQKQTFTVEKDGIRALRLSNHGAIVLAQINSVWERNAGDKHESRPATDSERAIFGNGKPTSHIRVKYVNEIVFFIPNAGGGEKVQAIGAERQPIAVEAY